MMVSHRSTAQDLYAELRINHLVTGRTLPTVGGLMTKYAMWFARNGEGSAPQDLRWDSPKI